MRDPTTLPGVWNSILGKELLPQLRAEPQTRDDMESPSAICLDRVEPSVLFLVYIRCGNGSRSVPVGFKRWAISTAITKAPPATPKIRPMLPV
ncbi:hypothetical protein E6H26_00040 [Candidatus Bathyarchaeota archaeon]|nr:MAG: hypothetical protein E6H26_00040 [Candidatus Bathyarchaeota archaeon]